MTKLKKTPRFRLVYLGLLFFANPYIVSIDVLPDFIGCILIYIGLTRAATLNAEVREARAAFLKLFLFDVVKDLALVIAFGAGSNERPTALLVASFSATVLALYFLLPSMAKLFRGFSSLDISSDCALLHTTARRGKTRLDLISRSTLVFLTLKEVFCLLPEFTALTLSSYNDSHAASLYEFIDLLRGFAFIAMLIYGVVWTVRLTAFFRKFWKENEFFLALDEKYTAYYGAHAGIAVERRYTAVFCLFFGGALLLTDFYLDFRNIFPDVVAAVLLFLGVLLSDVSKKKRYVTAFLTVIYGTVAAISSHYAYGFATQFTATDIDKNEAAARAYLTTWVTSLVECVAFLILLAMILVLLREVMRKWGGYIPSGEATDFDARARKELLREFDGRFLNCYIFGFVSALCSFFFDYIKTFTNKGLLYLLEYWWVLDFTMALLFACFFGNLLLALFGEIKNRFQYD